MGCDIEVRYFPDRAKAQELLGDFHVPDLNIDGGLVEGKLQSKSEALAKNDLNGGNEVLYLKTFEA